MKKLFSKTLSFAIVFAIVNLFFVSKSTGQILAWDFNGNAGKARNQQFAATAE